MLPKRVILLILAFISGMAGCVHRTPRGVLAKDPERPEAIQDLPRTEEQAKAAKKLLEQGIAHDRQNRHEEAEKALRESLALGLEGVHEMRAKYLLGIILAIRTGRDSHGVDPRAFAPTKAPPPPAVDSRPAHEMDELPDDPKVAQELKQIRDDPVRKPKVVSAKIERVNTMETPAPQVVIGDTAALKKLVRFFPDLLFKTTLRWGSAAGGSAGELRITFQLDDGSEIRVYTFLGGRACSTDRAGSIPVKRGLNKFVDQILKDAGQGKDK